MAFVETDRTFNISKYFEEFTNLCPITNYYLEGVYEGETKREDFGQFMNLSSQGILTVFNYSVKIKQSYAYIVASNGFANSTSFGFKLKFDITNVEFIANLLN
jgi:hypothetical protein